MDWGREREGGKKERQDFTSFILLGMIQTTAPKQSSNFIFHSIQPTLSKGLLCTRNWDKVLGTVRQKNEKSEVGQALYFVL